ncbi:iron chaperone [Cohnella herbarum]|uniref:YdhG-like domain-containing protein n=1 Tax=Cohnella herbarum TaxID=2728023 RepID=A0A7Z2VK87_9BACL|nr:DUF1801 domain-containing protein [Cohnella herbarum]QJD84582.1 hypothetical protein HH215_16290 [Cohnella herbarum]
MDNKSAYESIDHYISHFPPEVREILRTLRKVIRDAAPDAKEKISYQMPTFEQQGNLVHFAAYKNHIGFYPGANGIHEFQPELAGYKGAKGSVQFPIDKPLPYELIRRIVQFRIVDNRRRAEAKTAKQKSKK